MKIEYIKFSLVYLCFLSLVNIPSFAMDVPAEENMARSIAGKVRECQAHFEGLMTDIREYANNSGEQKKPGEWLAYWNDVELETTIMFSEILKNLEEEGRTVQERVQKSGILRLQKTTNDFYNYLMSSS